MADGCLCWQLLGELLLDRANGKVMMKYVSEPTNLMLMMILLKDNSRSIQFEAFHVFKVHAPPACWRRSSVALEPQRHPPRVHAWVRGMRLVRTLG